MKKNKEHTTTCPKCKGKIIFTLTEPTEDGFSIKFEKCKTCEHIMTEDEMMNFLNSIWEKTFGNE